MWNQGRFVVVFLICKLVQLCRLVCVPMGQSTREGELDSGERGPAAEAMPLDRWRWGPVHSGGVGTVPQSTGREGRGVGTEAGRLGDLVPGRSRSSSLITFIFSVTQGASLLANSREGKCISVQGNRKGKV